VPITNGKDLDFGQSAAGVPDVSQAVIQLFQPVVVGIIKNMQVDGYPQPIVEQYIKTKGVRIQTPNRLVMSKTGERIWDSLDMYFLNDINLKADDLFLFQNVQYRVIVVEEWSEYGYNKYSVVQDYTKILVDPAIP
jgi:hypothetical protein